MFEPHPAAGAGPIYDPDQPEYLLMNFAAEHVDMWWPSSCAVPAAERRSYVRWSGADPEDYPSRADVGRYLVHGLDLLLRNAPANVSTRIRRATVASISMEASLWAVTADGQTDLYDEVLIATGHQPSWAGELASSWDHAVPLVRSVFPVQRWLSLTRVAPGSTVAVRGFALTFIDAALALTEGRGGVFERLDHPYRLRYVPSEDDVLRIYPFSRTGRPMLPKPRREVAAAIPELGTIAESARVRIFTLDDRGNVPARVESILADTAAAALQAADGDRRIPATQSSAAGELARSLAVGAGLARPGPDMGTRPSVAGRVSGGRRSPERSPLGSRRSTRVSPPVRQNGASGVRAAASQHRQDARPHRRRPTKPRQFGRAAPTGNHRRGGRCGAGSGRRSRRRQSGARTTGARRACSHGAGQPWHRGHRGCTLHQPEWFTDTRFVGDRPADRRFGYRQRHAQSSPAPTL